jgi:hypothetical protein
MLWGCERGDLTVALRGFVDLPSGRLPLADLNDADPGYPPMLAPSGIGVFTPAWGAYTCAGAVRGLSSVTSVLVRRGRAALVRRGRAGAGGADRGRLLGRWSDDVAGGDGELSHGSEWRARTAGARATRALRRFR